MKNEVGKLYEVIAKLDWIAKGSVVEIVSERDQYPPLVKLISGWCLYRTINGSFNIKSQFIKPIEEKTMEIKNNFPAYDFKISTEGLSKEELEAAYEWLKDCAFSKDIGCGNLIKEKPRLYYFDSDFDYVRFTNIDSSTIHYQDLPEIKLNIETKSTVIGYSLAESSNETKLKEIICNLQQSLEEARSELANLKGFREKV